MHTEFEIHISLRFEIKNLLINKKILRISTFQN